MVTVSLVVDDADWGGALDNWLVLAHLEGVNANLEGAKLIQRKTRSLLSRYHHRPLSSTPSPIGEPPAMISGRLAASVMAEQDGDDAVVGPTEWASSTNGPYGRFLELGGVHKGDMWWWEDGYWHNAQELEKLPRPFLKPATDDAIKSGELTEIYWRRWLIAQQMATS
ncbi:hypothetical protein EAS64_33900 [Trebonia kvetii]|uniref:Uncharacterized protein n=1 Tax=Trebonia kvetii TaxID=2480626 RepID=A0A6P2BSZ6_9ACTN|nr:hypothetical protein [Trebonia kvetii]TVZ01275.1 hypothetical protein EAS64_33900 [Trebonia kvetii]